MNKKLKDKIFRVGWVAFVGGKRYGATFVISKKDLEDRIPIITKVEIETLKVLFERENKLITP